MLTDHASLTLRSQKGCWHDGSLGYSCLISKSCIGLANTLATWMGYQVVLHDHASMIPAQSVLPSYTRRPMRRIGEDGDTIKPLFGVL